MARIVLAEDHTVVRAGLRHILEHGGHTVVGETGDGLVVVGLVERVACDVLLLDLGLPGLHGLDILRELTRRVPAIRVVILSGDGRDDFVISAIRQGAAGYLVKSGAADELLAAIDAVSRGQRFVTSDVSGAMARAIEHQHLSEADDPYERLSHREREVFHLMAEGLSNKDLGARLFISPRTAEDHRSQVIKKLGLRSQTDVVLYALRRGLLSLDR